MSQRTLQPGDVVGAYIWVGLVRVLHVGVVSYNAHGRGTGVISNSLKHGKVTEERLEEFAKGGEVYYVGEIRGRLAGQTVVRRARSRLGEPYSLFSDNCEHFVRWAHGLTEESPQLQVGVAVGGLLAAVAAVAVIAASSD